MLVLKKGSISEENILVIYLVTIREKKAYNFNIIVNKK